MHSFFGKIQRRLSAAVLLLSGGWALAAPDETPFPDLGSKKGLQVQMVDDALALGVKHAALNVNLAALMRPEGTGDPANVEKFTFQEKEYAFATGPVASLDRQVARLSKEGVAVYLILLAYRTGNAELDAVALHPRVRADHDYSVAGFNSLTEDGVRWLRATAAFLAARYSGVEPAGGGRVWGYIVGNEINSHFMWYNMGLTPYAEAVSDYEKAFRLAHEGVRAHSRHARLYISLDHFWTMAMPGRSGEECGGGKEFIDRFAALARERGDYDWHLAHHPYPEDLGNPRAWADKSAAFDENSPRITFRNLEVLARYFERPELQWQGKPRRIILSEQGFHTPDSADGETLQAAAYAYAWEKAARLPGIDAFIYHRHVDHREEGGLRLGLWARKADSVATPERQKPVYSLFKAADTEGWAGEAAAYLPVTGLKSWDEVMP